MASKTNVEQEFITAIIGNGTIDAMATNYFGAALSGSQANDWTFQQSVPYPFIDVFCRRKVDRVSQDTFIVHLKLLVPRNFDSDNLIETESPIRSEVARNHLEELKELVLVELKDHLLAFGVNGNKGIEFLEIQSDTLEPIGENDLLEFIEFSFTLDKCL